MSFDGTARTFLTSALPSFALLDEARRRLGFGFDRAGWGPLESSAKIALSEPGVTLNDYGGSGANLLLIPAPIKGAYIWDLAPPCSVVARALAKGFRVFVLVWREPEAQWGLADYADRMIGLCRERIVAQTGRRRLVLAGHSLGGTLAAVNACLHPQDVSGLVVVGAPLDFGSGVDALAPFARAQPSETWRPHLVPGSLLTVLAVAAAPVAFSAVPALDRLLGSLDREARETLLRVERWSLDELPMAGALLADVMQLYQSNDFVHGRLEVDGQRVAVDEFEAPVLAVVDARCPLVPPEAVAPFLAAIRSAEKRQLRYHGDRGVLLQHVGMLVGRAAHREIWPNVLAWIQQVTPALRRAG